MLSETTATAPGKLMLLGEYAVLDGSPSVVIAVNRRARVRVRTGAEHNLVIAPEICDRYLPFSRDDEGKVHWGPMDEATRERLAMLTHLIERFAPDDAVEIETDTSAFFEEGIKLGFGSSAAVTVAVASALSGEALSLPELVELHRDMQDGRGSGFDIAASRIGGVCRYQFRPVPVAEPLQLPDGLLMRCVWTGSAASTTAFLRGLDAVGPRREAINDLMAVASQVIADLKDDPGSWVRAVEEYTVALQAFARATTLPIFAGGHSDILELASQHGVAYKPSGAGGGDIGVAVSADPAAMQSFLTALRQTDHRPVNARPDPEGLLLSP
ncbi:MAG: hypothetical protein HKN49_06665 [Gammaproteobacteria bacterium]|nr:hypothetical protein [Gammaproteobacteria bacterium]